MIWCYELPSFIWFQIKWQYETRWELKLMKRLLVRWLLIFVSLVGYWAWAKKTRRCSGGNPWKSSVSKEQVLHSCLNLVFFDCLFLIVEVFNYLYIYACREAELQIVSDTTNSRVARYSIMSLGVCILASSTQILYLQSYFQKKKLI